MILIGAPGAGKTSVLEALSTQLEIDGVEHGAIESEQLAWGAPLLGAEAWIPQLAAVLNLQRAAGRTRFLLTATVESAEQLLALRTAVGADPTLVVCLSAPAEVLAARVSTREADDWPGKQRLVALARELADSAPSFEGVDLVLDTRRPQVRQLVREIVAEMRSRGLL
jgi:cytidylate kinase